MTITEQQLELIQGYVTDKETYRKLTEYLSRHEVIGEEVFPYLGEIAKDFYKHGGRFVYRAVPKDTFIRRIPFYFYKADISKDRIGDLQQYINGILRGKFDDDDFDKNLENLYSTLELLLYYFNIDLEIIFEYPIQQTGQVTRTDTLHDWAHYLKLAERLNIQEKMPRHLIVDYNFALEQSNLSPIIYDLSQQYIGEYISRSGNVFSMQGIFPCEKNGQPILRWIGVKINNAARIWIDVDKKLKGTLYVEAKPDTAIWGRNCWGENDDGSDAWYELYIAPKLMQFDYEALKAIRKREKLTQQQVADSIGAAVRTYQKWESGDTTPDCHYLLRLLNLLDIREPKEITKVTDF